MGPSPLRMCDSGKKLVEVPASSNIKSKNEKTANSLKKIAVGVGENDKNGRHDPDVCGRKRKRITARDYRALFKPQRIRIESDDDKDLEEQDNSPQANTSKNEDVGKELKSQNSIRVQEAPDEALKACLDEKLVDVDQAEHVDCPSQTKPVGGKSTESGNVEKQIGGKCSPSNKKMLTENIDHDACADSDNHISHASTRINHDLENQLELDSSDKTSKVRGASNAASDMENVENNDAATLLRKEASSHGDRGSNGNIYISTKFVEFWVPVQMSNIQLEQYCATLLSNGTALCSCSKVDTIGVLHDICISNRKMYLIDLTSPLKCCNHPYLVDPNLQGLIMKDLEPTMLLDAGIKASGKLHFLDLILPEVKKRQQRVVILFQAPSGTLKGFASIGDILEDFVHQRFGHDSYERVDFGINRTRKQAALNNFNKDMSRFIFLLEHRMCHSSIKLSSVDIIIIFDSDLNPANDLRALQKLSFDSQSEQMMIFRLYSSSTLEEKILKLAEQNVAIDNRLPNVRSRYDVILTWGASKLFNKLTEFHNQSVKKISSEESLLKEVVEEFINIISHKCKTNDTANSKSIITQVQQCGIYGKSVPLHSEIKAHLPDGNPPYIFWRKLLEGQFPPWKFVSVSASRKRKRPHYFGGPFKERSDVDTAGVKIRRLNVSNNNTIEPAALKPVIEVETGGVNEVSDEKSLDDFLKHTMSDLCKVLKFSEDVKTIVETFLEFVIENYVFNKERISTLQAFMISLCWLGSSISKFKINKRESFALAKKHLNFSCMLEEAEYVYLKLEPAKEAFLQHTENQDVLKATSTESTEPKKSNSRVKLENHVQISEDARKKDDREIEKFNKEWDENRVNLENYYKVDKALIHTLYSNPLVRFEKLKLSEKEFANKLEEYERMREIRLKDLKATLLAAKGQVAANHNSPQTSHATVSSVPIGEIPEEQHDDMDDDVAGKVDSVELRVPAGNCNKENIEDSTIGPDTSSIVVEERNEASPNNMTPHVDSAEIGMPGGNCNGHNDLCGSSSSNSLSADVLHDKTPSVQLFASPASDHLVLKIPEIQNKSLQLQQLPHIGIQDSLEEQPDSGSLAEIDVDNDLQPVHTAGQLGQIIPEDLSLDPCNVNNLNQVGSQMPNQADPFQAEVDRLNAAKDNVVKFHEETIQRLKSECEKEITEMIAKISVKYEAKRHDAEAAFHLTKKELDINLNRLAMNKILANAFRSKIQHLNTSGHAETQQVSQAGLMQQPHGFSVPPSTSVHHHLTNLEFMLLEAFGRKY